jgi:hypothetical protein
MYNKALHQLFIHLKKAYDSVTREVLYNIHIESGSPMNLIMLTKMFSLNLCTDQLLTESDDTRCYINTICPPDDEHIVLETCRGM